VPVRFARGKERQSNGNEEGGKRGEAVGGRRGPDEGRAGGVYNKACRLQDTWPSGRYQTSPAAFGVSPQNPRSGKPRCSAVTMTTTTTTTRSTFAVETLATFVSRQSTNENRRFTFTSDATRERDSLSPKTEGNFEIFILAIIIKKINLR